jgi:hypothetical protein
MPKRKKPANRTPQEEIATVIAWAKQSGQDDAPAIQALQREPTPGNVFEASDGPPGTAFTISPLHFATVHCASTT